MKVLLLDNYDSFTYNLAQYLGELGHAPAVHRNDEISLGEVEAMKPDRIVISPGPGRPEDAGITVDVIRQFGRRIPVLGVCLGHQGIGHAFGGDVVRAPVLMHGKVSSVQHDGRGVFAGVSQPFVAGRYHSLIVADPPPDALEISARTDDGIIMGLRHREWPVHGVQFHPESVLTGEGMKILRNFLELHMFPVLIDKLQRRVDLTVEEAAGAMETIMDGRAQPSQIAGFLVGLAMKGERPDEIVGLARTMRARATKLSRSFAPVFDTCGTGGDGAHTFNVSTVAALVLAACGVRVAKHGNRSASSRCGSADLFEAARRQRRRDGRRSSSDASRGPGIAFLFAQVFHPSMKHAARDAEGARRQDGVQPARPAHESRRRVAAAGRACRGRSSPSWSRDRWRSSARSARGSCTAPTASTRSRRPATRRCRSAGTARSTRSTCIRAMSGSAKSAPETLRGGDAADNAAIARAVLAGQPGAPRDIVLLNAERVAAHRGEGRDHSRGLEARRRGHRQRPRRARCWRSW